MTMKHLVFLILAFTTIVHGMSSGFQQSLTRNRMMVESTESPTVSPAPSTAMLVSAVSEAPTVSPAPLTSSSFSLVSSLFGNNPPPPPGHQNSIFGFNTNPPPPPKKEDPKKKDPLHPNALNSPWRNPGFTRSTSYVTMTVLVVTGSLGCFLGLTL